MEVSIEYSCLPATHFFVYKNKEFPFNMALFNLFSDYFQKNNCKFEENSRIKLLTEYEEEDIELTDESISDFISYCQNNCINLHKENVIPIRKLSEKYMVQSLIKVTEEFVSEHKEEFIIQYLLMNKDQHDSQYEEIIAKNFTEYIQQEQLMLLSLPTLYRIVKKYQENYQNKKDGQINSEFIDFLFKCLERYGRQASILFEQVDMNSELIRNLLLKYSDIFDFHFINTSSIKTIFELESKFIEKEEVNNQKFLSKDEFLKENSQNQKKNEETKEEIKKIREEMNFRMRQQQEEISCLRKDYEKQLNYFKEEINQLSQKVEQQNKLIDELKSKLINQNKISCHFSNDLNAKGIISYLNDSVKLKAGGKHDVKYPLSNIKNNDSNYFFNYSSGYSPHSEKDGFIEFDFGPSKKIDLFSYTIRSNSNNPSSSYHPKSWKIEGSNDELNWTLLDERVSDTNLNGIYKQHYFPCCSDCLGNESNRYRYIRYVQTDSWCPSGPHNICITYFELFGDIYDG